MSHQVKPINFHHNPTDYCTKWLWWCYIFQRQRLSVSSKSSELFFHYISFIIKQHINPTVTLNNVFIRSKTSLFSANDTTAHLGKKYGGGVYSVDSFLWIISFHVYLQEWKGVRWNSPVSFDFLYQYCHPWMCRQSVGQEKNHLSSSSMVMMSPQQFGTTQEHF